jgi:hypothetical protein
MSEQQRNRQTWNMGEREQEGEGQRTREPQQQQQQTRRGQGYEDEDAEEDDEASSRSSTPERPEVEAPGFAARGIRTIMDIAEDDDDEEEEDDGEYVPPMAAAAAVEFAVPKRTTQPKKRRKGKGGDDDDDSSAMAKFKKQFEVELDAAEYYVAVSRPDADTKEWTGTVAKMNVGLTEPFEFVENDTELWIYFSLVPNLNFAYAQRFENREGESDAAFAGRKRRGMDPDSYSTAFLDDVGDKMIEALVGFGGLGAATHRKMQPVSLVLDSLRPDGMTLALVVVESKLQQVTDPSDVHRPVAPSYKRSVDRFLKLDVAVDDVLYGVNLKPDVEELYGVVKQYHAENIDSVPEIDPQHRSLLPKLRPYQKDAVRWMIQREKVDDNEDNLHVLYKEIKTLEGDSLYYNQGGCFFTRDRPVAKKSFPGGILADEMGLGKTVEVLSLMLCHSRPEVPLPKPLDPIILEDKTKKKRSRRRRTPSPVEFVLKEEEIGEENTNEQEADEDGLLEAGNREIVKGETLEDPDQSMTIKDETMGTASPSASDSEDGVAEVGDDVANDDDSMMQVDGNDDDEEEDDPNYDDSDDKDFAPSGANSKKSRNPRAKRVREEDSEDEEDDLEYVPRASTSRGGQRGSNVALLLKQEKLAKKKPATKKQQKGKGKAKVKNTVKSADSNGSAFDPKVLIRSKGNVVTAKSCMSDMIIDAIMKNKTPNDPAVTFPKIRSHITKTFDKTKAVHQNSIKSNVKTMEDSGLIVNVGENPGPRGRFKINPDYADFDTRGKYIDDTDPVTTAIEEVITRRVYNGIPFDREARDAKAAAHAANAKPKPKLYDKLKSKYDMILADMSEANQESRRRWNGTYFDTKVGQQDYFECVCGSELLADYDSKFRVQCVSCQLWQHAECVKYDVTDRNRGEYRCPHCWTQEKPVPSGATLIVSPTSISYQWIEEIQKHIRHKNLRMLFYEGTKQSGYIQPHKLAQYDIVITTYSILQSETNYVDLPHSNSSDGRRLRNPKRFMAIPAPLPCIQWWRVCLDEAQMIENTMSRTAEMALRLSAVNRW